VITHLFATHGKITPQQIRAKENTIYNMAFDISQPVDTVFNAIEDLSELADHANSSLTPQQMMDLAYVIFAKHPILQQDLRTWNRTPLIERTWANMLIHFREAQNDLSSLPTAADMFHQANAMNTMADLVAQRLLDAMPPNPEAAVPSDTINTVITQREISLAAREAALLTQMQEMMTVMRTGTVNTHSQQRRNNRGRGGRGRNNDTPNNGNRSGRQQAAPRLYCWSHGACAHSSAACNTPSPGHQTTATFQNMQGGSTNNLQWVPTNSS
jgi:hypothetical protein